MKFTFVILHYLTFKDTVECINSIINNLDYKNFNIIVVDNGSPNDSGEQIKRKYMDNENIIFIKLDENIGFAKGNNHGYRIAKETLKSDFIAMINNDTIINQSDFVSNIIKIYKEEGFDLFGPDIISTKDGNHQNPQRTEGINKLQLKKMISRYRLHILLDIFGVENIITKLLKYIKRNEFKFHNEKWKQKQLDVQLHGSCLVFSPTYIEKYKGLYDNTFMYMEEDILYYVAKKENLKIVYSPEVRIYHKEDSATDAFLISDQHKRIFKYKNILRSARELLEIYEDDNKYRKNMTHTVKEVD